MGYLSNIYDRHVKNSTRNIFKVQNVAKPAAKTDSGGLSFESVSKPEPYSTAIKLCPTLSGDTQEGSIYRRLYFDKNGNIIKKLFFDEKGNIERKELFKFDKDQIQESAYITDSDYQVERYYMKDNPNHETEYDFFNPEKSEIKSEYYTFDKNGRKKDKSSIGYGGIEELFTKYIYVGNSKKYTYREVYSSNPENKGKIHITLYYQINKGGKLSSLLGFVGKTREQVDAIKKGNKDWMEESDFLTEWEYNENGNQSMIMSTEKPPSILNNPVIKNSDFEREFGYSESETFGYTKGDDPVKFKISRIITEKSTFEYKHIEGEPDTRLYQVVEWLPRYNEPYKAVKKYTHYDQRGNELKWAE